MKKIISLSILFLFFSISLSTQVYAFGTGLMQLSPSSATKNVGDMIPITLLFHTGGEIISGTAFKIAFSYSGSTPQIDVVDGNGNPIPSGSGFFTSSVSGLNMQQNYITRSGGSIELFASFFPSIFSEGWISTTPMTLIPLGTFNLKVISIPTSNPTVLRFNASETVMYFKNDQSATSTLPLPASGSYTVSGVTPQPTPTATLVPTSTPTGVVMISPSPTPTTRPTISLKVGWNKLVWISDTILSGIPIGCTKIIQRRNAFFISSKKDYSFLPSSYGSGITTFIHCTQVTSL